MKFIGKIKDFDTLYILQDGSDIYVCFEEHLDFPASLGYDPDLYIDCIKNLKVGDKVEVAEWLLAADKKTFKKIVELMGKKK